MWFWPLTSIYCRGSEWVEQYPHHLSPYRSYIVDWDNLTFYCKRPAVVNIGRFRSECFCFNSSIYVCPHSYYDLWLSVIIVVSYFLILNYATPFCVCLLSILCLLLSPFSSPEFLNPFLVWRQLPMLFLFFCFLSYTYPLVLFILIILSVI